MFYIQEESSFLHPSSTQDKRDFIAKYKDKMERRAKARVRLL